MGGEPTFVSIDDYQSAEWNTAALGPHKRLRADDLIHRLRDALRARRPAALRPRQMVSGRAAAALGVRTFWRTRRPAALARQRDCSRARRARARRRSTKPTLCRAHRAAARPCPRLCAARPSRIRPSSMLKEGELPDNVDPATIPRSTIRRARPHLRMLERRLGAPAAMCCRCSAGPRRPSGRLGERAVADCAAGGSIWCRAIRPLGFRLPLKALPELAPADYPHPVPADPSRRAAPCRSAGHRAAHRDVALAGSPLAAERRARRALPPQRRCRRPRTDIGAHRLCVEPRDGKLCVFMPPIDGSRTISSCWRPSRRQPPSSTAGAASKAIRRPSIRASTSSGHARSGRHRGQYPPGRQLARGGRRSPRPL